MEQSAAADDLPEMVDRLANLILATWNGTRWLLPTLLAVVGAGVLWIDRPLLGRWLRQGEPVAVRQWITENIWILVGLGLAAYLTWHYPHDW